MDEVVPAPDGATESPDRREDCCEKPIHSASESKSVTSTLRRGRWCFRWRSAARMPENAWIPAAISAREMHLRRRLLSARDREESDFALGEQVVGADGRTLVLGRPSDSSQPREVAVVEDWVTELQRLEGPPPREGWAAVVELPRLPANCGASAGVFFGACALEASPLSPC